jgi:hypothetical protein
MAKQGLSVMDKDNLVLSTDWPHDSRFPHALDAFLGQAHLSTPNERSCGTIARGSTNSNLNPSLRGESWRTT